MRAEAKGRMIFLDYEAALMVRKSSNVVPVVIKVPPKGFEWAHAWYRHVSIKWAKSEAESINELQIENDL